MEEANKRRLKMKDGGFGGLSFFFYFSFVNLSG